MELRAQLNDIVLEERMAIGRVVKRFALSLIAVVAFSFTPRLEAQGCSITNPCPSVHGPVGSHFRSGTQVTVYLDPAFTEAQRGAIRQAFGNWQNAQGNSTGIVYDFQVGNVPAGDGVFNVYQQQPTASEMGDTTIDEFTNSATTRLAPGLTSELAIRNTMAHEIGHTMGLDDCEACCPGTTIMAGVQNLFNTNASAEQGSDSPTTCDIQQSNQRIAADAPKTEIVSGGDPDHRDAEPVWPNETKCYDYYLVTYVDSEQWGRIIISVQYLGRSCS